MIIKKLCPQGNGTALYLPRETLRHLNLQPGDYVVLRPDHKGQVIIEPLEAYLAKRDRPTHTRPR